MGFQKNLVECVKRVMISQGEEQSTSDGINTGTSLDKQSSDTKSTTALPKVIHPDDKKGPVELDAMEPIPYVKPVNNDNSLASQGFGLCVVLTAHSLVFKRPQYEVCFLKDNTTENMRARVEEECNNVAKAIHWNISFRTSDNSACVKDPVYLNKLHIRWVGSKVNYFLSVTGICVCLFLCTTISANRRSKFKVVFASSNIIWLCWRLQETVQQDTRWRDNIPYLCIVMYYIQYLSQTTSLYLLSCLSFERLYAVVSPVHYRCSKKARGHYKRITIVIAFLVGSVGSTLNLSAVLTMKDDVVQRTCRLAVSKSNNEYLGFTVITKVAILIFVFVLPCTILV